MPSPSESFTVDSITSVDEFDSATRWAGTFPVRVGGHTVIPGTVDKAPKVGFKEYTGSGSRAPTNSEVVGWRTEGGTPLLLCDHPTDPTRSLAVVDVDDPAYFAVFEAAMATYGVDASAAMIVTTGREGGGRHYYFRREEMEALAYSQANGARAFLDWMGHSPVDLKGVRSYVVCPGATHKSGLTYRATLNGQPVPSLAEAVAALPVMPLKVWQALKAERPYSFAPENQLGSETGGAFTFETGPRCVATCKGRGTGRKGNGWATVFLSPSHAAYGVFRGLVGTKTSLYVAPDSSTGYGEGDSLSGRSVGLTERGDLKVTDWATMIHYIFTDRDRAVDRAGRAGESYKDTQTRSPARPPHWAGRSEAFEVRKGYLAVRDFVAPVEVWQAGRGVGKTEAAVRLSRGVKAAGGRIVVVSPLRSLTQTAAARFGIGHYEDSKGPLTSSVSVCAPSLYRVSLLNEKAEGGYFDLDRPAGPDLLVVDEIEQTLQQIAGTMLTSAESRRALSSLIALVAGSRQVLLLDADAGPLTAWLVAEAGRAGETAWRTGPKDPERKLEPVLGGHKAHVAKLLTQLSSGFRLAIACMSKNAARTLATLIAKEYPSLRVLLLTGEDNKGLNLSDEATWRNCDVLIYTPVMATGVSVDIKDWFDFVHLFTEANVGDARMALQMIHRIRRPRYTNVSVSGSFHKAPPGWRMDPKEIRKRALRNAAIRAELVEKVLTEAPNDLMVSQDAQRMFSLSCISEADAAANGAGWVYRKLCGDAIDRGADELPSAEEKMVGKELKKIREDMFDAEASEIAAVNPASLAGVDPEADTTPAPHRKAMGLCRAFGAAYELADRARRKEIARADRTGDLRKRARTFALALAALDSEGLKGVARMDAEEMGNATPDRAHNYLLRANLLRKVSKMLGIDLKTAAAVRLSVEGVHEVVAFAKNNRALFDAIGVAIPSDVDARPVTLVSELLSAIGLRLDIQKLRDKTKGPEGRTRTYTINEASHAEMLELSREYLNRFLGKECPEPGARHLAAPFGPGAVNKVLDPVGSTLGDDEKNSKTDQEGTEGLAPRSEIPFRQVRPVSRLALRGAHERGRHHPPPGSMRSDPFGVIRLNPLDRGNGPWSMGGATPLSQGDPLD